MTREQQVPITAVISYAHSNPGWTPEQVHERQQQVIRFVTVLRGFGIDAYADVFFGNVDWSRWGPRKVAESDVVLVIASEAWKLAWLGSGDEHQNKGVRAETDVVRSIQARGQTVFQRRCRIILLPGSTEADIPDGMDGLMRYRLDDFTQASTEPLLRDLTDQPARPLPPLGKVPVLPPAMDAEIVAPADRAEQMKGQLAALPEHEPDDDPSQPWFKLREKLEAELGAAATGEDVTWFPAAPVDIRPTDTWDHRFDYDSALVVLHLVALPQAPLSQRLLSSFDDLAAATLRRLGLITPSTGLQWSILGDARAVAVDAAPMPPPGTAIMGRFQGCRMTRAGQLSIWFSLPRDHVGAVLDESELANDLNRALGLGATLVDRLAVKDQRKVAVAAELAQTTALTDGSLGDLGTRSSGGIPLAFNGTPRLVPNEALALSTLRSPAVRQVAATIAQILVRERRQ